MNISKNKLSVVISGLILVSPIVNSEPNFYFRVEVPEVLMDWADVESSVSSEWVNAGEHYNCSWSGFDDTAVSGSSYSQSATCSQDQTRTLTYLMEDSYSGEQKEEQRIENRTVSVADSRLVSVLASSVEDVSSPYDCTDWEADDSVDFSTTEYNRIKSCSIDQVSHNDHLIDEEVAYTTSLDFVSEIDVQDSIARLNTTCLTLKEQDSTIPDGYYPLSNGNTYQCDMSNGGWTLVTNSTLSTYALGGFSKATYGGVSAYWAYFSTIANGVYRDALAYSNSEGLPWTQAKMTVTPSYFSSVDSYGNTHGGAVNRGSLDGMFFDGVYIKTGSNTPVMAMTQTDNASRRSELGIPDSKSHIGASTKTFTFDNGSETTTNFIMKGLADQYQADEAVGYQDWIVWLK